MNRKRATDVQIEQWEMEVAQELNKEAEELREEAAWRLHSELPEALQTDSMLDFCVAVLKVARGLD